MVSSSLLLSYCSLHYYFLIVLFIITYCSLLACVNCIPLWSLSVFRTWSIFLFLLSSTYCFWQFLWFVFATCLQIGPSVPCRVLSLVLYIVCRNSGLCWVHYKYYLCVHGWLACLVYKSLKSVCVCVPAHVYTCSYGGGGERHNLWCTKWLNIYMRCLMFQGIYCEINFLNGIVKLCMGAWFCWFCLILIPLCHGLGLFHLIIILYSLLIICINVFVG